MSLIIAALAVFVGPLVTLRIGRKQIELSRRIASKQVVAPMRQAWINTFREKLAELTGNAFHYWSRLSKLGFRFVKEKRPSIW
jgi:hypothetical protein